MSPRKSIKKPAQEIETAEVESTEPALIESTEENPEIESADDQPVEITGAAEVTEEITDQGDPEMVQDSGAQTEEPISEVVSDQPAEVTGPITTDPQPESAPNEGHNASLVADNASMATSPAPEATDAPVAPTSGGRDPRLPAVGAVISRRYKDRDLNVRVLDHGFEFEGQTFKSLSKLAGIISGQVCNGFAFFRLTSNAPGAAVPKAARQASKPTGDKLAERVAKIDGLIGKLRAALDEGAQALAEAEAKRAEMAGTAQQG